eukprot:TRINITY_DN2031_c0_g2_i2.p1 TRINITY_DN2031_c0_g2~~TRINITY_DN2031_c0_g2_i2.p1  ORF type:complete len:108 (-),score=8.07 TRINITY_DN2031_c0_g2_i2:195-518(-)
MAGSASAAAASSSHAATEDLQVNRDGVEWRHVAIVSCLPGNQPKVECLYCNKQFHGGGTRIRAHIIGNRPAVGVANVLLHPLWLLGRCLEFRMRKTMQLLSVGRCRS